MIEIILSAVNVVKSGFSQANEDALLKRLKICNSCEFWDSNGWQGLGKCKKCGCSGLKLKMAASKCPIGNWSEELT